jgi:glyoxylate utilization-related uncharacterized protein
LSLPRDASVQQALKQVYWVQREYVAVATVEVPNVSQAMDNEIHATQNEA